MVANMSTVLGFPPTGFPQVIVVGIAYDIKNMFQWAAWRTRDLTPTINKGDEQYWEGLLRKMSGDTTIQVETGGAPRFLNFICDELVPFIESEYQISDQGRALAGYSYGGLFILFAMFERPEMFQRYFAGSPSINYGNRVLFEMEKGYSQNHTDLNARLYLSIGGLEDQNSITGLNEMANLLKSRNYPNLDVRTQVFEGEWHGSAGPASIMRAFINLYEE
ncbi:MAG: alpha/beta hydrolase [Prolixibacteraceae bacterium]|nr:alpha/beta hydrolase [Prolixibacteraceae bacterium]